MKQQWVVWREVEYDDGFIEIHENTVQADTIEEAIEKANERNAVNLMLHHVERAQTVKAEIARDSKEERRPINVDYE